MSDWWAAEVLPFCCECSRLVILVLAAVVGIELIVVCVGPQAYLYLDC